MVIDSSAIVAILRGQEERDMFLTAIEATSIRLMSALSVYETAVVIYGLRQSKADCAELWQLLEKLDIQIVPFGRDDAVQSVEAYQEYGKGIHSARLNLGDCPVYALAKARNLPLLYKGDDFAQTDIKSAL